MILAIARVKRCVWERRRPIPTDSGPDSFCRSLLLFRAGGGCGHPTYPRLNTKPFEKLTNEQIGENIRTEANIGDTVKPMDEVMDSWACEVRHASANLSRGLKT